MALFQGLSERLNHVFSKLKNKGKLTELEIKQAMREVRIALLEADVNFTVVKKFIDRVSAKAVGEDILKSLDSSQQVIKIVNEELIALLGSEQSKLAVNSKPPSVYMMCGLQGAGKTTMCGKLALHLKKQQGKKPLLVACDIYRPAAIKQLQVLGKSIDVPVFEMGQIKAVKIVKNAIDEALKQGYDTVIIDTAGRLHINEELMEELKDVKAAVKPDEILLVVDSMTLDITGVILTKLDSDTRGGAALSIKEVTGKPIKFAGMGEKLTDLEPFYPDRMASRILGMGDVLTLIEKAQNAITEEQALKLEQRIRNNTFTLEDYLEQFDSIKKMGKLSNLISMMPGMGNLKIKDEDINEDRIARMKAIILSMTVSERRYPETIKGSRKRRIAQGSGTTLQDVNQLLKQFESTKELMKRFSKGGRKGIMNMNGLPGGRPF